MLSNVRSLNADEQFVENVNRDIKRFVKKSTRNCVLIFPPVTSFHRFLIHQTCDTVCPELDLCTFSIGQGPFRRTVLCYRNQLLDPSKLTNNKAATINNSDSRYQKPVENWRSASANSFAQTKHTNGRYSRWTKMGAGNNEADNRVKNQSSVDREKANSLNNCVATNDAAVISNAAFVTRAPEKLTSQGAAVATDAPSNASLNLSFPTGETAKMNLTTESQLETEPVPAAAPALAPEPDTKSTPTTIEATSSSATATQHGKVQMARRERRPDRAVYVPRARRSQTTPPTTAATMTTNIATTAIPTPTTQVPALAPAPAASVTAITATTTVVTAAAETIAVVSTITTTTATTTTTTNTMIGNCSNSSNNTKFDSIISNANASGAVSTTSSSRADETSKRKPKSNKNSTNTTSNITSSTNGVVGNNSSNNKERRSDHQQRKLILAISRNEDISKLNCNPQRDCDKQQANQSLNEIVINTSEQAQNIPPKVNQTPNVTQVLPLSEALQTPPSSPSPSPPVLQQQNCSIKNSSPNIIATNEMNTTKKTRQHSSKNSSNNLNGITDMKTIKQFALPESKLSNILIEELATNEQQAGGRHNNTVPKCDIDEQELQRASKEINRSNRRIIKQTFVSDILEIPDKIEIETNLYMKAKLTPTQNATFDSTTEDEEDDWESKFNESGDCLDPKILKELETAVGKVKITKPKTDYSAFLANQSILNDEEFPHVLEVSNFPVEFKNHDLLMVFSQYKESGFDIKWVDDTHALAVFSSSRIAAEVLTMGHPFVVLKPLADATVESRLKAKKCASSLQPYKQRPETCTALARRLVTGALGMRLETAAAERENEKRVLRKAKERKLLAAKQRDEAWES